MLYPIQNHIRNKLDISGIWDFQIDAEETGEEEGWQAGLPEARPMAVPGSWNEQYEDLFNYFGLSWYVKKTFIPSSWKGERVFIRVGSACYLGTVYINGYKLGAHEGGHLPFEFEITEHIQWGSENTIAISVENHLRPTRVPSAGMGEEGDAGSFQDGLPSTTFDFFPFAGLHRPVVLYSTPQTRIEDIKVITGFTDKEGWVRVKAQISGKKQTGTLTLCDGQHKIEAPLRFEYGKAEAFLKVADARLWSDKDPFLYDLTLQTETDCYALKVGIRTVGVRGGQILLNGQPVQMNGFGRHEDFYASGKGLNLPLMVKDYQLMRWTGANSYRTSHYPYSEEEMQLADREGFLIIDETPAVSLQFDNDENMAERKRMCLQQIEEMITRDKNHPCVLMWSVANEPMPANLMARFSGAEVDAELDRKSTLFLHELVEHARKLDHSRPITMVGVMGGLPEWLDTCDVACINRYWGWYFQGGELEKSFEMFEQELDNLWELWKKPIIITEFGTDTQPGLHGHPAVMWTEEYQAEFIRGYLEIAGRKDFVAGMQVWNFADFAAVQSPMRVGGMNLKGVFTRARQPKMAAQILREFWVKKAVEKPQAVEEVKPASETPAPPATLDLDQNAAALLEKLVQRVKERKPDLTTTLKFDLYEKGIYRLIIVKGECRIEEGDGKATAGMQLKWQDAQKLFDGKLNPVAAVMTGKIKTEGNARAFLVLQELL